MIDFRLRPPLAGFRDLIMYADPARRDRVTRIHGFEPAASAARQSIDLLLAEMEEAGIACGLMTGRLSKQLGSIGNDDLAGIAARYPGRFVWAASVDPSDTRAAIAEIDRSIALGARAVNIEPGSYPLPLYADDPRLYPVYAHCEARAIPVIVMHGGSAGPDLSYTHPSHIDRVAADFPAMQLAISHGNWPWVAEILHVAFRRPNVWLSPDQYLANLPGSDDYVKAADGFLADRFLYASSYPFTPVREYAQWFRRLPIRPASLEKIISANARRLLKLGEGTS